MAWMLVRDPPGTLDRIPRLDIPRLSGTHCGGSLRSQVFLPWLAPACLDCACLLVFSKPDTKSLENPYALFQFS